MTRSKHPYIPYIPENATKLIIGTMPPYRFCLKDNGEGKNLKNNDVDFYYGSSDNYFWELLSNVTNTELSFENTETAINQHKDLLNELNTGIIDIIESCVHLNKKSDDKSLEDCELKDIRRLLEIHPHIKTLLYTSEYVKRKMNQLQDKSYHTCIDKTKRKYQVTIDGKTYDVIVLYSPSPMALRNVTAEKRFAQYKETFICL